MDSPTLPVVGVIFLIACPVVTILLVIWARVFFKRGGLTNAEAVARAYLDFLQAQDFARAASLISVTVLRDDAQRRAWINKMEQTRDRKRLVRYTLGRPRVNLSHEPHPGQVSIAVEAAERMRDKDYPAHLTLRLAIDKQSGQHRIAYAPEIYEETQVRR